MPQVTTFATAAQTFNEALACLNDDAPELAPFVELAPNALIELGLGTRSENPLAYALADRLHAALSEMERMEVDMRKVETLGAVVDQFDRLAAAVHELD